MKQIDNLIRVAAVLFVVALAAAPAYALHPVPTVVPDCSPSPTGAPIDGGASVLLASGAIYAVRRIRKNQR